MCRQGADYLSELLYSPGRVIRDAERHLACVQFDSIVGTGLSGALAAPLLARHFDVPFAVIRKPDDRGRHSTSDIEGSIGSRWLMADDRITTGASCGRVRDQVSQLRLPDGTEPQFVGLYVTKGEGAFWAPDRIHSLAQHVSRLSVYRFWGRKALARNVPTEPIPSHQLRNSASPTSGLGRSARTHVQSL